MYLRTDIWRKYAALAVCDPLSATALTAMAIGGGALSAGSTIAGGASAAAMGRAQAGEASFEAAQERENSASDIASAQRKAIDTQTGANLAVSRARAVGGASGVNVGTGSAVANQGDIAARGRYAAALDVFNGRNASTAALNKAAADDYQGQIDIAGGKAAQNASYLAAGGTLMSTIASAGTSAYKMYGMPGDLSSTDFGNGGPSYPMYK